MKRFGTLTFVLQLFILTSIAVSAFLFRYAGVMVSLALPIALSLSHVFNTPIISIGNGRLSIFTLNPFRRNINVALADIHKLTIEDGYTVRYTVDMAGGEMYSMLTAAYTLNMQPLHKAVSLAGIRLEKAGEPVLV